MDPPSAFPGCSIPIPGSGSQTGLAAINRWLCLTAGYHHTGAILLAIGYSCLKMFPPPVTLGFVGVFVCLIVCFFATDTGCY